jgi:hypothetical protein
MNSITTEDRQIYNVTLSNPDKVKELKLNVTSKPVIARDLIQNRNESLVKTENLNSGIKFIGFTPDTRKNNLIIQAQFRLSTLSIYQ